jgi:hypothetical protein
MYTAINTICYRLNWGSNDLHVSDDFLNYIVAMATNNFVHRTNVKTIIYNILITSRITANLQQSAQ